jgi:hypothetical protein
MRLLVGEPNQSPFNAKLSRELSPLLRVHPGENVDVSTFF